RDFKTMRELKLLAVIGCLLLGACASNKDPIYVGDIKVNDSYESYNRGVFAFNDAVSDAVIHPVIKGYRAVVPSPARKGVRNVLVTLKSPVTLGNQVLQGDIEGAGNVLKRTAINVLVGAGGLFDVAGYEGIEYEQEDFGQTLAVWGVDHGPYLVVPFLGPSSLRDYTGYFVDGLADPLRWYLFNIHEEGLYYTKVGMEYLDLRESLMDILEDLEESSIDYYAATRSIYYQQRQALIEDRARNKASIIPAFPEYDDEDF
ncbi:MAG: VacJ family lipoprotein, partial [Alphaproteobacteria bacterium]